MIKYTAAVLGLAMLFTACKKSSDTTPSVTNNYNTTTTTAKGLTVDGIFDLTVGNYGGNISYPLTFNYHDSVQEKVTASISGEPSFITFYLQEVYTSGTYWIAGPWTFMPTFTFPMLIHVNSLSGSPAYVAGTYKITLTTVGTLSGTKTFDFNIICE